MAERHYDHIFGQDAKKPGELRTLVVVLLTAAAMVLEIAAGLWYGSMALLADGLHMASHATALTISVAAYICARKYAADARFSFGTGKINSLAGYTGAVLLLIFAVLMAWESTLRLLHPVRIVFDQALLVAVAGLIVNGLSVLILHTGPAGGHDHDHAHGEAQHHHDHNLRSAYLHVLADALTSLLAIAALLAAKYLAWNWLDPLMGIAGALLVARWSLGLLGTTGKVLLDYQGPRELQESIRRCVEDQGDEVHDLHLWLVAPAKYILILSVVTSSRRSPDDYRSLLSTNPRFAHITVEVLQVEQA